MRTVFFASLAALCLSACAAVGPEPGAEAPALPDAFAAAPDADDAGPEDAWWTGFRDAALTRLVETGLTENRDIAAALARLEAAEAGVTAARAGLVPQIDGEAAISAATEPGLEDLEADPEASGLLSYTPDLFGRQRRAIEAARADAEAEAGLAADTARLTAAAIARRYVALARAEARFALLETSLDLQRQTLRIVEQRFDAGLSAGLDLQRAEADLARTEAQRGTLTIARAEAANSLAVLTGRTLADWEPPEAGGIPRYDRDIEAGAPARPPRPPPRPRAPPAAPAAPPARAGRGPGRPPSPRPPPAPLTPALDAGAFADSLAAEIAAVVDIPLFDAGARRADLSASEARAEAALADYEQTILLAVADVETALTRIDAVEARRTEFARAVEASEAAFDQLNALYREGLATFIDILDAQRTLIGSREAALEADAALAEAVIDLHAALGAGALAANAGARR